MDDEGAFPVFEAVLVAILVLTALVFVSSLRTPSQGEGAGGIDFGRVGADTLRIMEERAADDPVTYENRLEEVVSLALQGDAVGIQDAEEFLVDLLPDGTRYVLRIDNGIAPITLLPQGDGPETRPRAARAAGALILPDWTANLAAAEAAEGGIDCAALACTVPGGVLDLAGAPLTVDQAQTVTAPDGSTTAPTGDSWLVWWKANRATNDLSPPEALYGVWKIDTGSGTTAYFRVTHPDGTVTDRPVYGVQMVVWYGA